MISVYTVTDSSELMSREVSSLKELQDFNEEAEWFWADFVDPTEEEYKIISELLESSEEMEDIRRQKIFTRPEKTKGFILFSISQTVFRNELKTFPIYILVKGKGFVTIRNHYSSKSVKNALKTFGDCVGKICDGSTNASFIVSRLFHEISNENLDVVMRLRESIDQIEEKALNSPADKRISRSVFSTKRDVSAFERILWSQRELMLNVSEGVIPKLEINEEIKAALNHPINNISREISLLDSHYNALDSILSLQDLGMIHSVERNLIRLTILALIVSIILILLEIDVVTLLSG